MPSEWFKPWGECVKGGVATIDCVPVVLSNLISALIAFTGLVALIMFLFGGFKMINSSGDPKKLESARNNFTFALLGLSVSLLSFVVLNIISQLTGVKCITTIGFGCN